ncbi:hypothetical protein [Leucothrix mucor]|uniref:hypothetical protein n=1 Tax=Leucothrix mucor TaxID=45248 RepID=UPI0012F7BE07|nr:hypothetical protein [Leucothrix mucor]
MKDLRVFLQNRVQSTDSLWQLDLIWDLDQIVLEATDKFSEKKSNHELVKHIGNEIANLITKENTEIDDLLPILRTLISQHCRLINQQSLSRKLNHLNSEISVVDKEILSIKKVNHSSKTREAMKKHHRKTNKNKDIDEVKEMWFEWKLVPNSGLDYKNNEDFANKVCLIFPSVKSSTILKKCTLWAKEFKIATKKGRPKK